MYVWLCVRVYVYGFVCVCVCVCVRVRVCVVCVDFHGMCVFSGVYISLSVYTVFM